MDYEVYRQGVEKLGHKVLITKDEFESKYKVVENDYTPTIKAPHNSHRPLKATFENSEKAVVKKHLTTEKKTPLPKVKNPITIKVKIEKPKKEPHQRKTAEEIAQNKRERQLRWYYNKKGVTVPEKARNRVLRKDMTHEQLKEHISKLASSRRIKKKEDGTLPALTEQQIELKKRDNKNYYERNKDCLIFKARAIENQKIRRAKAKLKKEEEKKNEFSKN